MIEVGTPLYWETNQYELIDTGNQKRLERFGKYVLIRPEPQAIWEPHLDEKEWYALAHCEYEPKTHYSGIWKKLKPMDSEWIIGYRSPEVKLRAILRLGTFKNIGIFPEQALNWDYIAEQCRQQEGMKVLNLFAYTGLASIAARAKGAEVTQVDAMKSAITWAKENMLLNHLGHIRWLVDDVKKFVAREVRRGNRYNGILLDPPAFGHGPKKEKWQIEEDLPRLLQMIAEILNRKNYFLILNVYSPQISLFTMRNLVEAYFSHFQIHKLEWMEVYLQDRAGRKLHEGHLIRMRG